MANGRDGHPRPQTPVQGVNPRRSSRIRSYPRTIGFDMVDFKIDTLNKKIDGVAADLSAHRKDTEAHGTVYRVKEDSGL